MGKEGPHNNPLVQPPLSHAFFHSGAELVAMGSSWTALRSSRSS